jgi:hypothetical protein
MISGREHRACFDNRAFAVAFISSLSAMGLGCGGISNDPNGINGGGGSRAGSNNAGAAGSAGAAGAAGAGGSSEQGGSGGTSEGGSDGGTAGGSSGGAGGTTLPAGCPEPNPIPGPGAQVVIRSVTFDTGVIVLQNVSDTNQTILGGRLGWQWCNFPVYWNVVLTDDNVVLSPGETFSFVAVNNTMGQWSFDPEGGELGIYTTTGAFREAELMRAFVSWADAQPSREATAVEGGYWTYDERIEIGANDAGFVIVGESNRAAGYQGVPARCLVDTPNQ